MKTRKRHLERTRKQGVSAPRAERGQTATVNPMDRGTGYVCAEDACYVPTDEFALGRQWLVIPD